MREERPTCYFFLKNDLPTATARFWLTLLRISDRERGSLYDWLASRKFRLRRHRSLLREGMPTRRKRDHLRRDAESVTGDRRGAALLMKELRQALHGHVESRRHIKREQL